MSNRCYIEFDDPDDASPASCFYEGSISDDEDDVSFCFPGPPGLLDRAMKGSEAAINELLGRLYMGCEEDGQSMMDFHWERGFNAPQGFPHLSPTCTVDEATSVVFAENDRKRMEETTPPVEPASKSSPRI